MTVQSSSGGLISRRTVVIVLIVGCLIAMISFGIRSVFGFFLEPMTEARGWNREIFALAVAIQNLLWGLAMPVSGALADRFGPVKVIMVGGFVYALGICGMLIASSSFALYLTAGVLTGLGIAFTSFSLALAAMAKIVGPEKRTLALGLGTAAGSVGQVVFSPLSAHFIIEFGWQQTLIILTATSLMLVPLAMLLPKNDSAMHSNQSEQTISEALREAFNHRGFMLLTFGFFVCGFHVAFVAVHFPAYVIDLGLDPRIGAYALAIVGLFNIIGSFISGLVGQYWSKKNTLSIIYFARALTILMLLLLPKTEFFIYLFAATMGLLWLSTVPLTTAIVAQVFGIRYMATLFGIVFFGHQLGSFVGVWMGGRLFDQYGHYDGMWWAGITWGLFAAVVHLPINEKPLRRLSANAAPA